ncbi:hypothetical protein DCO49_00240 [Stenotrophomonas sp. SPM]|uniref:FliM/FliN family flagellar motor C-terminal domain-containing protein n=1 Tax=Stenotrophomonas sp. SPM TaxID=2170735 RepID=UPI000DE5DC65|nr:FliM/FliN family flagellar motor C-terminal domain-containing protein [Stenotrophomonas sp. SPM]PWB29833.1 hypothetical protein DCO49_00240 [Stenotrophomonas sp. SPM]
MTGLVLRWQGPTRREFLRLKVERLVQEWLEAWAISPGTVAVVPLVADAPRDAGWQCAMGAAGGQVLAGLQRASLAQLGGLLAGAPLQAAADFNHALAVGTAAGQALLGSLLGGAPAHHPCDEAPRGAWSERHGWVGVEVRWAGLTFEILLDPVLCDRLDPPDHAPVALQSRRAALAHSTVALDARLELGHVDVSLISALRPGDVLRTGIPLDSPVALAAGKGAAVASGRLTIVDQRMAITIDSSR